jgi:hypothetical protein
MDVVLDSVCVGHLARPRTHTRGTRECHHPNEVTCCLSARELRVVLDNKQAIADEWKATAGEEFVQELLIHWQGIGGLHTLERDGKLDRNTRDKLEQAGFKDTIDRLIVRTAVRTTDRVIVSDDSDFWDPANIASKGDRNAPVARLLREFEGIRVTTLGELLGEVHPRAHSPRHLREIDRRKRGRK